MRPELRGSLVEVVPPRGLEDGLIAARSMIAGLAGDRLSLEVAISSAGPRWYLRTEDDASLDRVVAGMRAAYPDAEVERVPVTRVDLDPAYRSAVEQQRTRRFAQTDAALPLRAEWRGERDPLSGILAAAPVRSGERLLFRCSLGPATDRGADHIRSRAERRGVSSAASGGRDRIPVTANPLPLIAAIGAGAAALQAWQWYEQQEWLTLAAVGAGAFLVLPLLAALATRWLRGAEPLPAPVVDRKLATPLVAAALEVTGFAPADAPSTRLDVLLDGATSALGALDDPAGGRLRPRRSNDRTKWPPQQMPLLLSAGEVASLWHLPDGGTALKARRTRARHLPAAPGHAQRGTRVGAAVGGTPVAMPTPLLHRNQLIVAKTRRGKSTLLRHLASGVMARAAQGIDDTALVVVDPHQDLAEAVLASVPDALADRAIYLDFANLERPVGLNLIDVDLFPDRDRTTEYIVTMLSRLWPDNWGPRMEGALRAALGSLHDLNASLPRDRQYTLLDVGPLLTDREFRRHVLDQVDDTALQAWWDANYQHLNITLRQQTANPVTSKIGRFTVTAASRLVFGQAASTFDPRQVLRDGGVLIVNTAVGALGEGAASLTGATLLNLFGLLVEEQVMLPPERRRKLIVLVDESSTLGAVDYPRMLSELSKYGASFVLVTQSLAKLDAIDRNLAPTIFANADGLTVFQVSADDARRVLPELGPPLEVEDLVSLDDFECYARWWDGSVRPASFSFRVDPPPPFDADRVHAIAQRSAQRYGRPRAVVTEEISVALSGRIGNASARGRLLSGDEVTAASDGSAAPDDRAPVGVDPSTSPVRRARRGQAQRSADKANDRSRENEGEVRDDRR